MQGEENTGKRRAKMRQAVFQRFGFEEMAQRALGQYWPKRTPAEKRFVTLFSDLLERSYLTKIESYTGEQRVLYTKESIDKDYAHAYKGYRGPARCECGGITSCCVVMGTGKCTTWSLRV